MFNKLVDVLKEVFWLKKSPKKKTTSRRKSVAAKSPKKTVVKKKAVKSKVKAPLKPAVKAAVKPLKKDIAAKPAVKAVKLPKVKVPVIDPNLTEAGEITHYFERIKVCVVKVTQGAVLIGDRLTIIGEKTKFVQKVWSMQIESQDVKVARKGQLIGLKVDKTVVVGDKVYK